MQTQILGGAELKASMPVEMANSVRELAYTKGISISEVIRRSVRQTMETGLQGSEKTDDRTLMNLMFSLLELDVEAEENEKAIEETIKALGKKADGYITLNTFCKMQKQRHDNEIKFHQARKKQLDRIIEGLKFRAHRVLDGLEAKELKSATGHKIYLRDSEAVEILELTKIPDEYKITTVDVKPDKVKIKKALKEGVEVPGARLVENKNVNFK